MTDRKSRWAWLPLLIAMMVGVVALVPPVGEFPCSDDWDYKATVDDLVERGVLRLSDYPAMTLVGHIAWGALFVKLFGSSYFVLRLSVLVAVGCGTLALYDLANRRCAKTPLAATIAFAFFASPLTMASSYTFLTDASAVGFMLVWLACADRAAQRRRFVLYILLGLAGGFVYLVRQPAALVVVAFALAEIAPVLRRQLDWRPLAGLFCSLLTVVVAYQAWLRLTQGLPMNATKPLLSLHSDGLRFFDHLCSLVGAFALFALPFTLPAVRWSAMRWRSTAGLIALSLLAIFAGHPTPFVDFDGQTLEDLLLGYDRVMPGRHLLVGPTVYVFGKSIALVFVIKACLLFIALPGLAPALLGRMGNAEAGNRESLSSSDSLRPTLRIALTLHAASLAFAPDTFDRYLLPSLPLLALMLAPRTTRLGPAFAALALLSAAVGIVGTQDYLVRNRVFWGAVAELHRTGIAPDRILAGHAYAGINRFSPYYRVDSKRSAQSLRAASFAAFQRRLAPFDPDRAPDYIVSFAPLPGYVIDQSFPYASWLRSGAIVVLRRPPPPPTDKPSQN